MKKQQGRAKVESAKNLSRRTLLQGAAGVAGGVAASVLAPALPPVSTELHAAAAPSGTSGVSVVASSRKNIVETDSGEIFGFTRNGIYAFKGVPYGGPTGGKNRFMPPTKPTPWAGIRSALYWGPVSPQAITSTFDGRRVGWQHDDEAFMFEWEDGQPSEDCLRINVWTPSITDNKKRPVLMWIHGGGFTAGSSHELRMYDGESLSRRGDVVMVSVNHRLGVLGYMNLMDYGQQYASSPNVGMLDLVAALEWVKTNISNFGGDPGNVLIFGQSGGGAKVSALMGMSSAKGLFHRAVVQSGSRLRQGTPERTAPLAAAVIEELGLTTNSLSKIHDLPNEAIVEAGLRAQRKLGGAVDGWGPVVDGNVLPRHTFDPDAPSFSANVPLMVGSVLNEMANSVQMGEPNADAMPMEEVKNRLRAQQGDKTDPIVEVFQKMHPDATPFEIYSRISGMAARLNVLTQAERKAAQGKAPAFVYLFQWQSPVVDGRGRAFHCSELPFVFYNTELCATMTGGGPEALDLAGRVADAWINFAQRGNPSHARLPAWPAYSADKVPTMVFDTKCAMVNDPDQAGRKALSET